MSDVLPDGWVSVRVGEVFASHGGGTPNRGTAEFWNGNIPWFSSGDIKTNTVSESSETITKRGLEESSARLCRRGSVVVVVRSGILKHTLPVAMLERDAAINQDIKAFDSGDDQFNAWLALSWRASARDLLAENREGTTVQSVKLETLRDFDLPVPPLSEQRRIVAKLETLLGKVDACQRRLAKIPRLLKRFRQSLLAAACSGRLTADWRESHKSEGWRSVTISDVLIGSFYGPRFGAEDYSDEGVPTIRTTDMDFRGGIKLADSPRVKLSAKQLRHFGLQDGDLLVTRTGATIGKCALYVAAMGPAMPSAYLIRFRLNKTVIEPRFALTFFMSPLGQAQLLGGSTAVAQPNVNAKAISAFALELPPLDEQSEIVRRVEQLFTFADQLEARFAKAQAHVDKLTQSLLAKAFRGDLVPQDPNDEPAEKLLGRIRNTKRP